jgi:hypothetical protein
LAKIEEERRLKEEQEAAIAKAEADAQEAARLAQEEAVAQEAARIAKEEAEDRLREE